MPDELLFPSTVYSNPNALASIVRPTPCPALPIHPSTKSMKASTSPRARATSPRCARSARRTSSNVSACWITQAAPSRLGPHFALTAKRYPRQAFMTPSALAAACSRCQTRESNSAPQIYSWLGAANSPSGNRPQTARPISCQRRSAHQPRRFSASALVRGVVRGYRP